MRVESRLTREQRLELVRRQVDFERDPEAFCARFAEEQRRQQERISRAIELYPRVAYPDDLAAFAAGILEQVSADGYRGDIVVMRAARAAAALDGRDLASEDDVLLACRLALPHRMKRRPFDQIALDEEALSRAATQARIQQEGGGKGEGSSAGQHNSKKDQGQQVR